MRVIDIHARETVTLMRGTTRIRKTAAKIKCPSEAKNNGQAANQLHPNDPTSNPELNRSEGSQAYLL